MSGETDLAMMLATMEPTVRPGEYVVVTRPAAEPIPPGTQAFIMEREGATLVIARSVADERGWPYDFVGGWITLTVHSSLAAVGLTAAFAGALGSAGISCNVLAGHLHDHILVPIDRTEHALQCLRDLSSSARDMQPVERRTGANG